MLNENQKSVENLTEQQKEKFSYTYSARQQEEILAIRQKYLPPVEDKMEQLRKLDRQTNLPGIIAAIIVGLIGTVLFGVGLCCVTIESWENYFVPGIFIGLVGLLLMIAAVPLNSILTKYMRKRMAEKVLAITDELLQK